MLPLVGWPVAKALVGAIGGAIANMVGVPPGWLIGSMAFAAAFCCARSEARVPLGWRYLGQLIIGVSAGLSFTPALVAHVLSFLPAVLLAVVASIAMGVGLSGLLTRLGGLDRATAFFASMPGGVAEMSNLAERNSGQVAPVAVSQTLRIFLAVLTIPLLARAFGPGGRAPEPSAALDLSRQAMAAMAAAAIMASYALARWRVPNAWLLGAMVIGGLVAFGSGTRFHLPVPFLAARRLWSAHYWAPGCAATRSAAKPAWYQSPSSRRDFRWWGTSPWA